MATLLVVLLLFTLLLGQVAATNPSMDLSLSLSPIVSYYPDPDGILDTICKFCGSSIFSCCCPQALSYPARRASTFTERDFFCDAEWPQDLIPSSNELLDFETEEELPPLRNEIVRELDEDATTIHLSTIQIHVESTYNPGDRLEQQPSRRLAPRPGGFPCLYPACEEIFNRSCDQNRHKLKHLPHSERPHRCDVCHKGFLYPKDRNRHQRTHNQSPLPKATLFCPVAGCDKVFSRRDNLRRHQRNAHPHIATS